MYRNGYTSETWHSLLIFFSYTQTLIFPISLRFLSAKNKSNKVDKIKSITFQVCCEIILTNDFSGKTFVLRRLFLPIIGKRWPQTLEFNSKMPSRSYPINEHKYSHGRIGIHQIRRKQIEPVKWVETNYTSICFRWAWGALIHSEVNETSRNRCAVAEISKKTHTGLLTR